MILLIQVCMQQSKLTNPAHTHGAGLLRLESKKIFIGLANSRLAGKFDRELNLG